MKKITLTLIIIVTWYVGYSQTTSIPDSNFEQALIDLTIDSDGVVNGTILTADAAAVTGTLNIGNKSISDLTGIDAFTSITILDVRDNTLTSIDLTSLTGLLRLEAGNNSLTSINITGLSSLERLIIPNNSLTTLDLSGISTSLRYLYANGNNFTSLDVAALTGVQRLYVYENAGFSSIDVTTIPTLDRFRCYDTSIATLDLTQNPNLAQFRCYNNSSLTFVDLKSTGNTALTSFDSTNTPNLTCIQVDDVAFSTTNWTSVDAATTFSTDCSALSVNDLNIINYSLFPNPAKNKVTLILDREATFAINNISGQLLVTGTLTEGKNTINIPHLLNGLYFININDNYGALKSIKIIKK